ncbi:MAG: SDR family oxidoreductase [Planctomycetes bacterium]|nr:SDR family oxidoreductase [Planctomycetota bacterium]
MSHRKTAIVTGAGSGVGKATTQLLLNDGYNVVLVGRRMERLTEVRNAAVEGGADLNQVLLVAADVSDPASVEQLFAAAAAKFPRLDLLFNNAGSNVPAVPIEELSIEQWKSVLDVNVTGTFLCTRAAVRWMKRQQPQGGRIINNGSVSAQVPRPNTAPYTASKHAVTGLTRATALDGRRFNIACGQIDIGNAVTEMSARTQVGVLQANGQIEAEPMMDVANVARSVLHMASLPLDANILFLTVMATGMPFVGRG